MLCVYGHADDEESESEQPVVTRGVGVSVGGKKWDDEEDEDVCASFLTELYPLIKLSHTLSQVTRHSYELPVTD